MSSQFSTRSGHLQVAAKTHPFSAGVAGAGRFLMPKEEEISLMMPLALGLDRLATSWLSFSREVRLHLVRNVPAQLADLLWKFIEELEGQAEKLEQSEGKVS